jgi:hypothetical protein
MNTKRTTLGVLALVLVLAFIGGTWMGRSPKPETANLNPRPTAAAAAATPAHPAEAELNALGLTAENGIGVRASYRSSAEGGSN